MTKRTAFVFGVMILAGFSLSLAANELGRELILSQGCKGCHQIDRQGGTVGPVLDKVGKRLSPSAIRQKLLYPDAEQVHSRMHDYRHLSVAEIDALVKFLAGLR